MREPDRIVLIGEPDQATGFLYQRTLGVAFSILLTHNSDELMVLLRSQPIDVLVLEPAIFHDNVWERIEIVSYECITHGTALIICTTQDERRRWKTLRAASFLIKPTLPKVLLKTIEDVLGIANS